MVRVGSVAVIVATSAIYIYMYVCSHLVLWPPGARLEETIYTRLERQKPHRSETEELLGAEMGKASTAFGVEASEYGEREGVCVCVEKLSSFLP